MANGNNHRSRNRRTWLIAVGVIAAALLLVAFISLGQKTVPVRAEAVQRGTIASVISTNGKIEPINNFEAHAPAPTIVQRVLVHEGDQVKAGQLLLQLSDADARAQAAKAQAQLRTAEADLHAVHNGGTQEEVLTTQSQLAKAQAEVDASQRNLEALRRLQQKGAASAGEVEAAQSRLAAAQADLKLAQEKQTSRYSTAEVERVQAQASEARAALAAAEDLLRQSVIRAPRMGTVYSLPVRQGQFVNTGDLLVQVADLDTVRVRAFIDEPDIGRLRQGQRVDIAWDGLPGRVWQGTVTRIPATVVPLGSRNVGEITCEVANADRKLLPNVNVSVSVLTENVEDALSVPREAIHQQDGTRFVFQVEGDHLVRRDVKTGVVNLTRVQISDGVRQGDEVCLGALNGKPLTAGMQVRIVMR